MSRDRDRVLELLRKLDELRRAGLISEEEYNEKARKLLEPYVESAPPTPSTRQVPPPEPKETKTWRYIRYILAAMFVIIIVAALASSYYYAASRASGGAAGGIIDLSQPDIRVTDVYAKSYIAGLDVRVRVKAILYNYGDADGYAVVKLYTTWDTTRDESTQSVFVPVGSSVTVEADLDVPALGTWHYGAQVLSQKKA